MSSVKVEGMKCQHCVKSVTETLEKLEEISNVKVDLKTSVVSYDGNVDINTIKNAIAAIGFEVKG